MSRIDYNISKMREALEFDKRESFLLMPNEAVSKIAKSDMFKGNKSEHIAVAYSYLYLNTWLYRYGKYGEVDLDITTVKGIKNLLGVSPTSVSYDYIFKKNGVLDELGLTKTLPFGQAPVQWMLEDDEMIEFELFNELSEDMKQIVVGDVSTRRRQIKYPVLAMEERTPIEDVETNGTFYPAGKEFTHQIPFEAFMKCVTNDDLGTIGFYLYSFIRSRYGKNDSVQISLKTIAKESGITESTVNKYMMALREYGLMGVEVEDYVMGREMVEGLETKANRYWIIEEGFNSDREEVKIRKVTSVFNMRDVEFSAESIAKRDKMFSEKRSKGNVKSLVEV